MKQACTLALAVVLSSGFWNAQGSASEDANVPPLERLTFETHIRPILRAHCLDCHGEGGNLEGELDLRLRRFLLRGGGSGPAIVPGKPDESLLYVRIRDEEMPPSKKKLSREQVAVIARWIASGAATLGDEPLSIPAGPVFSEEERSHWAFRPIRRPAVPALSPRGLDREGAVEEVEGPGARRDVRTPVDAFLLAKLAEKDLGFSPQADQRTLLRRAYFDLTGLPPTPEETDRFLADPSPDAYERLLDRLLNSSRYGERWGRHWLDVAGYADSDGYTGDRVRLYAYKYRDYVIKAFNQDKPFDQFIQEQLAGDEDEMLRPPYQDLSAAAQEKLVATGFLRMAPDGTAAEGAVAIQARNQCVADTIQVVSTALLGLTVGCAQCHNHRYDPISQVDYYRFRAIFEPALNTDFRWRVYFERRISTLTDAEQQKGRQLQAEADQLYAAAGRKRDELVAQTFEEQLQLVPEELRPPARLAHAAPPEKRTPEQKRLLAEYPRLNVTTDTFAQINPKAGEEFGIYLKKSFTVRDSKPKEDFIRALTEIPGQVPVTQVFYRGEPSQPRQEVPPGELVVLDAPGEAGVPVKDPRLPTTGRRLAYARWLTNGKHPLTARVLVNRVWMHHFGRGLVATPADFGMLGEQPSHPELLDWLAGELIAGGWRTKHLHKLIMTSTAYRQISRRSPALEKLDPDNRLLGRMPVRRLEAEEMRDAILAVSGKLNDTMYGPPVPVRENEVGQVVIGVDNKDVDGRPGEAVPLHGEEFRRSVYVQVRRALPLGLLETFDAPRMEPCCAARNCSTVAPQALMFMNNEFVLGQAGFFAGRLRREAGGDRRAQVVRAWQLAFARRPAEPEVQAALAFVDRQSQRFPKGDASDPELQALTSFCQVLLGANEFCYLD
ncbi:MAG TPA: PSD1 and planctomycete cytochrome C domain-containing protein [Pirellulales bacterium]|nr:PSD1 and planctomycete cytochrome C domain-containing protein [Pirellulales bacterium]